MFSLQTQTSPQALNDLTQESLIWKNWKHDHPEFNRGGHQQTITYNDKILILGGFNPETSQKVLTMILVDPVNQTFKVIPSIGDAESCSWKFMSACYWKDSKIVVFGGCNQSEDEFQSAVAVVTLKDLDSENPSASWEKIVTPTELFRFASLAYIYKEKMFIFGGHEGNNYSYDIWCLDLTEFTWTECSFKDYYWRKEESRAGYVFHENKVYSIDHGCLFDMEIIREFDLETMACKLHTIPKASTNPALIFFSCPQVINGKMYFFENSLYRPKDGPPIRQLLAYDLDSQSWTEIKTESFPSLDKLGYILYSNNHMIFYTNIGRVGMNYSVINGEFWSLPLNAPKPSRYSSTSGAVNKVQQTMKEFFFEAPYSDVSFEVESQTIPAHKWLLTQKNKFFAHLFSNDMSASKLTITDFKAPTFRALLEYLYSDHVEIDDTIALELLQQANKYSIEGELKSTCEKHIVKNIGPDNYVAFGKLAESIEATSLRDAVVSFIAKNMKKIKPRKDFSEISDALLRDSIVKFLVK